MIKYIMVAGLIISTISCNSSASVKALPADNIMLPELSKTVKVSTARAGWKDFVYQVSANGKVRSGREQWMVAETEGRLLLFKASTGKLVQSGEVLIQLDTL